MPSLMALELFEVAPVESRQLSFCRAGYRVAAREDKRAELTKKISAETSDCHDYIKEVSRLPVPPPADRHVAVLYPDPGNLPAVEGC